MSKHIMCNECRMCDGDRCTYFDNDSDRESTLACILFEPKNPSLFHRITASSEVLAPEFVDMMYNRVCGDYQYYSMLTGDWYETYEEAVTVTLARLNAPAEINTEREG